MMSPNLFFKSFEISPNPHFYFKKHGDLRYLICYTKLITLTDEKIWTEKNGRKKMDEKKQTKK